jgi:methionyl-tRNA formyltransferase
VQRQRQVGASSLAPKITKGLAAIDWKKSNRAIFNLIRGMNPVPGAFTHWRGYYLKIFRAHLSDETHEHHDAGMIVRAHAKEGELTVQTGRGCLCLDEVQIEGKRQMSMADFLRGHQIAPGEKLG